MNEWIIQKNEKCQTRGMFTAHLCENVLHLGLLIAEAFYLLRNTWVFLQLLHRGPFTVQIRTAK